MIIKAEKLSIKYQTLSLILIYNNKCLNRLCIKNAMYIVHMCVNGKKGVPKKENNLIWFRISKTFEKHCIIADGF